MEVMAVEVSNQAPKGPGESQKITCFVSNINKAVLRSENRSFEPATPGFLNHATVNIWGRKIPSRGVHHHELSL